MVAMVIHEKFAFVIYVNLSWLKYFFTKKTIIFFKNIFLGNLKVYCTLKNLLMFNERTAAYAKS